MNLGQYIAEILLEQDKQTVALFPGAFKPPHKGHFDVVKALLDKADEVVVLISPKERDGIDVDESFAVWNLYKTLLDESQQPKVEIKVASESPIKEAYSIIKDNPDTNFILAAGKGETDRFKSALKLPNIEVFDAGFAGEGTNATGLRAAIKGGDATAIQKFLPSGVSVTDFIGVMQKQLDEVNHQTTDDTFVALVAKEEDEIERAAEDFNIPLEDLKYAFTAGNIVILSDDIWSKLENTDSYEVTSLEDAIKLAKEYGKDWKPTLDAIKSGKIIDPPLILNYDKTKYYLVGGNTRLMFYKALGITPKVLLGIIDLPNEKAFYLTENEDTVAIGPMKLRDEQVDTIAEFIKYAVKTLELQNLPSSLTLSYDTKQAKTRHTFGYFNPSNNKIWLYVKDRNVADILRTLAHELIHRKQAEQGRIDVSSGDTGSEIENEANAMAGVLLRNFGKSHEEIYEHKK